MSAACALDYKSSRLGVLALLEIAVTVYTLQRFEHIRMLKVERGWNSERWGSAEWVLSLKIVGEGTEFSAPRLTIGFVACAGRLSLLDQVALQA